MVTSTNPQKKEKKADDWVPPVSSDTGYLDDRSRDWIVWLGHACFLFQIDGRRYLTDPQLRDMPLVPRRVHPPFSFERLRGVDYLLISHDHRDHVDERCLRTLAINNDLKKIFAPLKMSDVIGKWVGKTEIEEAAWYQVFRTGPGLRLTFLPARHWCRRGLTDFNRRLWGSFLFEVVDGPTIYFGGDSAQTDYWREIGQLFPNIDLALLGIGAYKPAFMMQDNHASPTEAYGGFCDLGAARWWPMHHGTYDLSWEPASEPLRRARELSEPGELVQPAINEPYFL